MTYAIFGIGIKLCYSERRLLNQNNNHTQITSNVLKGGIMITTRTLSALSTAEELDGFQDLAKASTLSQSDCQSDGALSTLSWSGCSEG